jgi:hypothetical protein
MMPGVDAFVEAGGNNFHIAVIVQIAQSRRTISRIGAIRWADLVVAGEFRPIRFDSAVVLQDDDTPFIAVAAVLSAGPYYHFGSAIVVYIGHRR